MAMLDLVIFDMAGTTVHDNDHVNLALQQALADGGYPFSRDAINRVMGWSKPDAIRELLHHHHGAAPTESEVEKHYARFLERMLEHYSTSPGIRPVEGAEQAIRSLKQAGIKVALDTGFSRPIANAILERLGWLNNDLLDATVTSDEVAHGRPAPDLALEVMRRLGISNPARVAKVGDTPSDLQEGLAAGCGFTIGVLSGASTRAELEAYPHTHIVNSVADLPALLLNGH